MTTTKQIETNTHALACGHAATGHPGKLPHHHAVGLYCDTCQRWTALTITTETVLCARCGCDGYKLQRGLCDGCRRDISLGADPARTPRPGRLPDSHA